MQFTVQQSVLANALKIIKDSKALGKADDPILSTMLIRCNQEEQKIEIIATSLNVWACSIIEPKMFDEKDVQNVFQVAESGFVYLNGPEFIGVIDSYPAIHTINFTTEEKNDKNNLKVNYLQATCVRGDKKRVKKNAFLLRTPQLFVERPTNSEEKISTFKINGGKLSEAVNSVEFASGNDERQQHFWGVLMEIYGEEGNQEVVAAATDSWRICFYEPQGLNREGLDKAIQFCPIKTSFVAALKNMDIMKDVVVEVGHNKTYLTQENQWHIIPNVSFANESKPEWRMIIQRNLSDESRKTIKIKKDVLMDSLKTAISATGGKYGISLDFNTTEEVVSFSVDKIEDGGVIKATYSETESLDKESYDGEIKTNVVLTIDSLKDIVSRSNGEIISFNVKDSSSPVYIHNELDKFRYLTGVIN